MLPYLPEDLLLLRKAATYAVVRVDDSIANRHLEDAVVALYQLRVSAEFFSDLCRQTGGCLEKTSLDTIGNLDVYWPPITPQEKRLQSRPVNQ